VNISAQFDRHDWAQGALRPMTPTAYDTADLLAESCRRRWVQQFEPVSAHDTIAARIPSAECTQAIWADVILNALTVAGYEIVRRPTPECPQHPLEARSRDLEGENGAPVPANDTGPCSHEHFHRGLMYWWCDDCKMHLGLDATLVGTWPPPRPGSHESDLAKDGLWWGMAIDGLPGTGADEAFWLARNWSRAGTLPPPRPGTHESDIGYRWAHDGARYVGRFGIDGGVLQRNVAANWSKANKETA
jgi:hypothetical protein